ncbi:MAG: DNA-binding protein [Thermoleophilales bacterium]|nr:DNA-binding protein [Thermoleophilales bacterium]
MAQLLVRGLDPELVRKLKMRAAENGVSAEEEHRRILQEALVLNENREFADFLMSMPDVGEDSDFERPREFPREVEL